MKKFLKNTRAAAALEFAIILPVLLLLLLGIIQFGLTLFFDSSLNSGIRTVARQGVGNGYGGAAEINNIMRSSLGGLYDTNDAAVVMLAFDNFDETAFTNAKTTFLSNPDNFFPPYGTAITMPATGQSGKIILYGVKYKWGSTFGITNPFLPPALYSFAIVRNEGF